MDLLLIAAETTGWGSAIWGTTLTVLQVAFGLGLVIFVHELGHFAVAKWCGVRCDKFYLGFDIFGLKLFKVQWGETEYGIGALPLGGYVKMLGQDDNPHKMQEELDRAKMSGDLPSEPTIPEGGDANSLPVYDPRSYMAKSVPKRMAIISAGVIMNLIFAYIVVTCCYRAGVEYEPCVVSYVVPGNPAWTAGLRDGDEILEINGVQRPYFVDDLMQRTALVDISHGLDMKVSRPGVSEPFMLNVKPKENVLAPGRPTMGLGGPMSNLLGEKLFVIPESPADKAKPGFEAGDTVIAVDGKPVHTYAEMQWALAQKTNEPIEVTILRKATEEQAKDDKAAPSAEPAGVTLRVDAWPRRTLGLVMKMGPIVGVQPDSPAEAAGLKINDTIVTIDDQPPGDPLTLPDRIHKHAAGDVVRVTVKREGEKEAKEFPIKLRDVNWYEVQGGNRISIPEMGLAIPVETTVAAVEPGSPAEKAGLKPDDVLVSAEFIPANDARKELEEKIYRGSKVEFVKDEKPVPNYGPFMGRLQSSLRDTKVKLVTKDGRTVTLEPVDSTEWFDLDRGLNFTTLERIHKAESWGEAMSISRRKTWGLVTLVYRTLQKLVTGQLSVSNLGGPGTIAAAAGHAASAGTTRFFMFLAMLSANLAVINFLPIPLLDGGHMLLLAIEGVRGKPVPEKYAVMLQYVGLVFILGLMVTVFTLDGLRLFDYLKWIWS